MKNDFRQVHTAYPADMRTQLWPLCCGAKIISGFKNVGTQSVAELVKEINAACDAIPDLQVYGGETLNPDVTFLTLNGGQMASAKLIEAVSEAGFVQFAKGTDRNREQGFFVRNKSGNFKLLNETKVPKVA